MTTFDDVLEEAGNFGRCQKRIFALFCLVSMPWAGVYVGIVFQGFTPEHWCRNPAVSQLRGSCGWSLHDTRNYVPLVNTSEGVARSQCQRYELDWNATGLTCDYPAPHLSDEELSTVPTTTCKDGWEYDYEGRRSFVTEVRSCMHSVTQHIDVAPQKQNSEMHSNCFSSVNVIVMICSLFFFLF